MTIGMETFPSQLMSEIRLTSETPFRGASPTVNWWPTFGPRKRKVSSEFIQVFDVKICLGTKIPTKDIVTVAFLSPKMFVNGFLILT